MTIDTAPHHLTAEWSFPTRIHLGAGRLKTLPQLLEHYHITTPMILSDHGMANSVAMKKLLRMVEKSVIGFGIFTDFSAPATPEALETVIRLWHSGGFDGIVVFGGASVIDLGKLLRLFSGRDSSLKALATPPQTEVLPPLIAIPTLAGSGVEIRGRSYVYDAHTQEGRLIVDKRLRPDLVLYDPLLPTSAPHPLIAGVGMHALTNAIESWCSPSFNPLADAAALNTIETVMRLLPHATNKPVEALSSHTHLMAASVTSAIAATKGLGATSALAHSLNSVFKLHYGMAAGIMLPYVLAYNRPAIEHRIAHLTEKLGIKGGFNGFVHAILKLRKAAKIPTKLGDALKGQKIKSADKALIESLAVEDPNAIDNPLRLTKKASKEILNAALSGKMKRNH